MEQSIDITWAFDQFLLCANFSLRALRNSVGSDCPEDHNGFIAAMPEVTGNHLIYQMSEAVGSSDGVPHFGFNFDLIETNILNLAVVLGVVVFLGGDVLTSLLNDRKQKILGSLKTATEKFIDAEKQLEEEKQKIEIAKTKAIQIREQGKLTPIQTTQNLFLRTEEEIRNLDQSKQASLRFEEEKAINILRQQVVRLAIERVLNILGEALKLDGSLQNKLIETNIRSLSQL